MLPATHICTTHWAQQPNRDKNHILASLLTVCMPRVSSEIKAMELAALQQQLAEEAGLVRQLKLERQMQVCFERLRVCACFAKTSARAVACLRL